MPFIIAPGAKCSWGRSISHPDEDNTPCEELPTQILILTDLDDGDFVFCQNHLDRLTQRMGGNVGVTDNNF